MHWGERAYDIPICQVQELEKTWFPRGGIAQRTAVPSSAGCNIVLQSNGESRNIALFTVITLLDSLPGMRVCCLFDCSRRQAGHAVYTLDIDGSDTQLNNTGDEATTSGSQE
jgi:hypothetical protein